MQNKIGAPKGVSLSDPRVRAWLFQIITVVAVVGLGWYLFHNT
ncbi:MAG: amino acid ABC transporter permease, partial [Pseudomonas sp.]|nr:amino acid ABC transporter permease [Pseudomonas sp.]